MRMEGKNAYFKKISQIGNFKNIPYSVAKQHQRLLCSHLQESSFPLMTWNVDHVSSFHS